MQVDFKKGNGLVPCIVQDDASGKVLMLGFMNEDALKKTQSEKRVTFWSRSKQRLWTKGETSGNYLDVIGIIPDCDSDTLLIKARPQGPVCHTGADTCFGETNPSWSLRALEALVLDRKNSPQPGSYTNTLLDSGVNRVAQKVGEEAVEVVIASKDDDKNAFLGEVADLLYHLTVLLTLKGQSLSDVERVLAERHRK